METGGPTIKESTFPFRRALWLFAAVPALWTAYFLGIYLVSEAVCRVGPGVRDGSASWLTVAFLTSSTTTALAIAALTVWLLRPSGWSGSVEPEQVRFAKRVALGLAWFFGCSLLGLALPILWLSPC